jgi:hypothetical protein
MKNKEPSALYSIEQHRDSSGGVLQMTGRKRIPEYGRHKAQSNHDYAAELHIYAEHAHTVGAAHHREAAEKRNAVAMQAREPARAKSARDMPGVLYWQELVMA